MHGVIENIGRRAESWPANAPALGLRQLRVAIVNNMPDAALIATEHQFTRLLSMAGRGEAVVSLYHMPELPRGEAARAVLATRYRPVDDLFRDETDALIVTGNEPRAARLDAEPYWPAMARLIDWAANARKPSVWSCLAAHAAVLHLDQIERRRLPQKVSGVLNSSVTAGRGLTDLPSRFATCHSRLNEAPGDALLNRGYRIISEAPGGAVDAFSKTFAAPFLFLQGHPEYDADSLMREYRRDVGRYLNGTQATYPEMPQNYFDEATIFRMAQFRSRAEPERDARLFELFPAAALRPGIETELAQTASALFRSWFDSVLEYRLAG